MEVKVKETFELEYKQVDPGNKPEDLHWIKRFINEITVEPVIFSYIFSTALSTIAFQQLYIEKSCRVNLNFTDEICTAVVNNEVGNFTSYETDIQQVIASVNAWKFPLTSFVPALLILFVGSWSDRKGRRKPCFLVPLVGECICVITVSLSYYFMESISINTTALIEATGICLTGGYSIFFMGAFSYIADITSDEERTVRIGIITTTATLSGLLGNAISGIFYKVVGYYGAYSITLTLYITGILYGIFRLEEPKLIVDTEKRNFFVDFFEPTNVIETLKVTFKKRKNYERLRLILLLFISLLAMGGTIGEALNAYYYTRARYNWTPIDFNIFSTFDGIIHLIGTSIILAVFSRYFGITDPVLGIMSCIASVIASVWYGLATTGLLFYCGPLVGIFSNTKSIAIRSIQTKLVSDKDRGKVQSIFGVVDCLLMVVIVPIFSLVYEATVKIVPGAIFFMSAGFAVIATALFICIYIIERKMSARIEVESEEEDAITKL